MALKQVRTILGPALCRPFVYPVLSPIMDSISSNLSEYQGRIAARKAKAKLLDRRSGQISNFRLLAFAMFLLVLWLAIRGALNPWWIVAPLATFAGLVLWHHRTRRDLTRAQRAIHVYEWGIARIEDR